MANNGKKEKKICKIYNLNNNYKWKIDEFFR